MFRVREKITADKRDGLRGQNPSTIGEDLVIIGNVTSRGEVHVNGRIHGDVHCASLVFAEGSHLEGSAIAEDVIVRGRVIGSVRALRVTLRSGCHVEGDIVHQNLVIEQGAYFGGKSLRSTDPMTHPRRGVDKGAQLEGPALRNNAKPQSQAKERITPRGETGI